MLDLNKLRSDTAIEIVRQIEVINEAIPDINVRFTGKSYDINESIIGLENCNTNSCSADNVMNDHIDTVTGGWTLPVTGLMAILSNKKRGCIFRG